MSVNIVWFRRDLRLSDNPALYNATKNGKPIIPLFMLDENTNSAGEILHLSGDWGCL